MGLISFVDAARTQCVKTAYPVALTLFSGLVRPTQILVLATNRGMAHEVMSWQTEVLRIWRSFKSLVSPVMPVAFCFPQHTVFHTLHTISDKPHSFFCSQCYLSVLLLPHSTTWLYGTGLSCLRFDLVLPQGLHSPWGSSSVGSGFSLALTRRSLRLFWLSESHNWLLRKYLVQMV